MKPTIIIGLIFSLVLALTGCGNPTLMGATPQDDINLRDTYSIIGAKNINTTYNITADLFCDENGYCANVSTLNTSGGGGSGDITEVNTTATSGLQGGGTTGGLSLSINDTWINTRIDARSTNDTDTDTTYGNSSGIEVSVRNFSIASWFITQDSNDWDANADLSADEISEAKIDFDTACAAGNHLYVSGNDLACESDDDTTYTNGTGINLTSTDRKSVV